MEYNTRAEKFLIDTKTKLEIVKAVPQKKPLWVKDGEDFGINYSVSLENENGKYVFDFWDSITNKKIIETAESLCFGDKSSKFFWLIDKIGLKNPYNMNGTIRIKAIEKATPNAYDVLACLDLLYEETFEDFCSAFGYNTDSILALKTFEAVKEQDRNLRRLFSKKELEELTNIN